MASPSKTKERQATYDFNRKLRSLRNKPKEFWKLIKLQKMSHEEPPKIHRDAWFKHFATLHQTDNATNPHFNLADMPLKEDDLLDGDSEVWEVEEAVTKIKSGKSPGEDDLGAEIFKHMDQNFL